jgi:PPK2 family polyphosphate:nucleotide phosphotransferase
MPHIRLKDIDTRAPKELDKTETKEKLRTVLEELDELQNLLYASARHAVLVIVQGLDASGKDGLTRKVFGQMNPQGVTVRSYKAPTAEELSHDFLWRVHRYAPARGMIGIFNRSHYEDVLVTRVHGLIDDETAHRRMKAINDFEQLISVHNNTRVLKFYLHVSAGRQMERLQERTQNPRKMWKYNEADFAEAGIRDKYLACYEEAFEHCSDIPWQIVPADQNWYKEYLVAKKLCSALKGLDMHYPGLKRERGA